MTLSHTLRSLGCIGLLLGCVYCSPSANSTPNPSAAPRSTAAPVLSLPQLTPLPLQRRGQSVMLVTLAGARADVVEKLMADGALPTLARMASLGVRSAYLQPLDPSVAASTQMSMLTGASPSRTGIVADNFRKAAQAIGQSVNGFDAPSDVEPIWRSAMRTGARTALVGYPASTLALASQRADLMVSSGAAVGPAAQHVLKFSDAKDWKNAPTSFSPPKEAHSAITQNSAPPLDLWVLALDTTNDQQDNYDTWLFSLGKTVDGSTMRLQLDEWGTLVVDPLLQSAAALHVTDANPAHFAVYQSAIMVNQIAPVELARAVTRQFGAPPAPADGDAFERNWMDDSTYVQMAERQSEWLTAVATFVTQQYKPDLLSLRLAAVESAARELLLTDARQPGYAERAPKYALSLRRGYQVADAALGQLFTQLDLNTNALLVVSDRGMAPAHTVVNLNRLLSDRKWLTVQKGAVDLSKSKAYAEASDGIGHIYISLKGRDANGIIEPVDYDKLQAEIFGALKELNDPIDGQPIFARVLRKQELGTLGLQNDNSGDVVVQARPGFVLSAARERNAVLEPATFLGASGYDASLPEMRGVFIAHGAGIRQGARLSAVGALDLAPTIASLLRFTPPTFVEGRVIEGVLK